MTTQTRPDELIRILRPEFVTKAGGVPGAACVIHTCGATGWRAAGGTIARTLVHEVAFQLSTVGNARGSYAIDLQQVHWGGYGGTDVAAGDWSAILTNEENRIGADCDYAVIIGPWTQINDNSNNCYVLGANMDIVTDNYGVVCVGHGHDVTATDYGFYAGYRHNIDDAFGCYSIGEQNDIIPTADWPAYSGNEGIFNFIEGDIWLTYQFGEKNTAYGAGTPGERVLWSGMWGFENYIAHVISNYAFGRNIRSYRPTYDGFYDGRIIWAGDGTNKYPDPPDPPESGLSAGSGYNQDSWFSQNDLITDWAAAWTTSRFEFPIIVDSIWGFTAHILGTEQGCANTYDWRIRGMVENDGGTTTIKWSIVDNYYRDVVTKEWQVIADDPNDRLVFQFRDTAGSDPNDCNIQMSMHTVEVGFAA